MGSPVTSMRPRRARACAATVLALAVAVTLPARAEQLPPNVRAVQPVPASPPPPQRNLVLLFNAAGLLGNPFDGDRRGWRIEAELERRKEGRISSAVVIGGGSAAVKGYPEEWMLGLSAQIRWNAIGNFERGLFLGSVIDFRRVGIHVMSGAGPLVGYRYTTRSGVAAEVHLGLPLLRDSFTTTDRSDRLSLRDAWSAMLPGVFIGVGASLRTDTR